MRSNSFQFVGSGKRTKLWVALAAVFALVLLVLRGPSRTGSLTDDSYFGVDDYSDFPEWPQDKRVKSRSSQQEWQQDEQTVRDDEDALVKMAREAAEDGTVIVVYASYSYRQPLFNWLVALRKAKGSHLVTKGVLLVCLDGGLAELVQSLGWSCFRESIAPKRSTNDEILDEDAGSLNKDTVKTLWVARVNHLQRILGAGLNVVLSDTDAIWLKDARITLGSEMGDIIASRANFPYDSPWGATLCMGFIFFRATPEVIHLSKSALEHTILAQDDQIGFNRALFALPFEDKTGKKLAFGRKILPSGVNIAKASFFLNSADLDKPLRVTLLSHTIVPRYCALVGEDDWQNVLVAHCHVNEGKPAPTQKHKGNQATHTAILEKYNVYFLRSDWESIVSQSADRKGVGEADEMQFDELIQSLAA